jgi:TonB family protein
MKLPLLLILIVFSGSLFGQTTRKTHEDVTTSTREEYDVLKSDKSIKQGQYTAYTLYSGRKLVEGFYKNNLKDSLWKQYSFSGDIIEKGFYKEDKKVGDWYIYDQKNELQIQYNYTARTLEFYKLNPTDTSIEYNVINGRDTVQTKLDRPPIYLNGEGHFNDLIGLRIRYPKAEFFSGMQGRVIVAVTVDTMGNISNYRIMTSVSRGFDEEAMRVVKLIDGNWLPGILNGKPVPVEKTIPIAFKIQSH